MTHIKLLWRFRCGVADAGTFVFTFCPFALTFCTLALTFCPFALTFWPFTFTMDLARAREPCDCILAAGLLGPFLTGALPFATTTTFALPCNGLVARPFGFDVAAPLFEHELAPREAAPSFVEELDLLGVC